MTRRPIDEETALKLISCLEGYNENRYFISEFKMEEGKKKKIGIRLLTEQDKKEERELATKMLKNKRIDYEL